MKRILLALFISVMLIYSVFTFGVGLTLALLGSFIVLSGVLVFIYTLFLKEEEN